MSKTTSNRRIKKNLSTPNYILVDGMLFKREVPETESIYNNILQFKNMKSEPISHKNNTKHSLMMRRNIKVNPK